MDDSKFLITGANGQLGLALQSKYPNARASDSKDLDIKDWDAVKNFDWGNITTILNTAAYTDVDGAETSDGRPAAWKVNAVGPGNLAKIAREKDIIVVHISSDYVFDGSQNSHTEEEPLSPLGVYGASKAAGDLVLSNYPKHYILRTSFVIGEGNNFVRIMLGLGQKGVGPSVIADQLGRITFTGTLVGAIDHLLSKELPFGTYNVSNEGDPVSWAELTRAIFKEAGLNNIVSDTTTAEYYKDKPQTAARPLNSVFDLSKIEAAGFKPNDWRADLAKYIKKESSK